MGETDISQDQKKEYKALCAEYIAGSWAQLTDDNFQVERITGGLSNLLYLCTVDDKVETKQGEQRKVLLRIYGQMIRDNPETVVTDSIVFALLAERTMGPKLFGVFTGGRLEEYVPSHHLATEQLQEPVISMSCARIMAKFHQLSMPLAKEPSWLNNIMDRFLGEILNNLSFSYSDPKDNERLQKILSFDLPQELERLKDILGSVNSPIVFCHNDMQEGNILVSHHTKELTPIDFEYAAYNHRGFDLGNHFCEWCYDYSIPQAPYFSARIDQYPSRDQQLTFIRAYLEQNPPHEDYDPGTVEESLIVEADTFALGSHFMWALWSVVQSQISDIEFGYLAYSLSRLEGYFYQKANLPWLPRTTHSST